MKKKKYKHIFYESDRVLFLLPNHLYMVQKYISSVEGKGFMQSLAVHSLPLTYLIILPYHHLFPII